MRASGLRGERSPNVATKILKFSLPREVARSGWFRYVLLDFFYQVLTSADYTGRILTAAKEFPVISASSDTILYVREASPSRQAQPFFTVNSKNCLFFSVLHRGTVYLGHRLSDMVI
jgi:hypothetical protein